MEEKIWRKSKVLNCGKLYETFKGEGIDFFTGVPDSTFKDWMKFLADNHGDGLTNIVAANECEAVAVASGYHFSTGSCGVVYMQNSGFGKTVNPITSLADPEVYSVPMLLMIGWRGEPEKKDEPQHKKMGRIMLPLLDVLEIPYVMLPEDQDGAAKAIAAAKEQAMQDKCPYALIVRKGIFEAYEQRNKVTQNYEMNREDAIKAIVDGFSGNEVVVSTTGKASRELFELREALGQGHQNDFLTVGSMGCSSSIALGVTLGLAARNKERPVFIFDGDGAAIMQEGAFSTIGHYGSRNLTHILFDNEAYGSTGGQPTTSPTVNFVGAALANNYKGAREVKSREGLVSAMRDLKESEGPQLLVVKVNKGARKDLGRPTTTPIENKVNFMNFLSN